MNFDGPSGTRRDVSAQIAVFRSALQVLWAEQMGQETIVLLGLTTDVGSVQTFRR